MKFVNILAPLALLAMTGTATADDLYECTDICYCDDDGNCVCIQVCDVVEGIIDRGLRLGGSFGGGTLTLKGFPREMNGQSLSVPNGTITKPSLHGKTIEDLVGARVAPGKYTVNGGAVSLKIDR